MSKVAMASEAVEQLRPYLVTMVKRTSLARGLDQDTEQDLLQEVFLACLEADPRFDATQNKSYRSYQHDVAQFTITSYCWRRLDSVVPLSDRLGRQLAQVRIAKAKLSQELGREPRNREVADVMGMTLDEFELVRTKAEYEQVSLEDMNGADDGEAALGNDYIGWEETLVADEGYEPEGAANHVNLMEEVYIMLDQIHPEEKEAIILTYGLNGPALTIRDAATKMGKTTSATGRMVQRGVQKLKGRLMLKGVDMGGAQ